MCLLNPLAYSYSFPQRLHLYCLGISAGVVVAVIVSTDFCLRATSYIRFFSLFLSLLVINVMIISVYFSHVSARNITYMIDFAWEVRDMKEFIIIYITRLC